MGDKSPESVCVSGWLCGVSWIMDKKAMPIQPSLFFTTHLTEALWFHLIFQGKSVSFHTPHHLSVYVSVCLSLNRKSTFTEFLCLGCAMIPKISDRITATVKALEPTFALF